MSSNEKSKPLYVVLAPIFCLPIVVVMLSLLKFKLEYKGLVYILVVATIQINSVEKAIFLHDYPVLPSATQVVLTLSNFLGSKLRI